MIVCVLNVFIDDYLAWKSDSPIVCTRDKFFFGLLLVSL
eukprot:COSAG02_NODE_5861_length_3981_cov_9.921175_3_plen_39_part_00